MTLRPGLGRKRIASVIVTCASVKRGAMRPAKGEIRARRQYPHTGRPVSGAGGSRSEIMSFPYTVITVNEQSEQRGSNSSLCLLNASRAPLAAALILTRIAD